MREIVRKRLGSLLSGGLGGPGEIPFWIGLRGPTASELGARFDEVRGWAAEWERAASGPLRVEYKKVGGRSFGANEVPYRAWIDGYEQAWQLLGVRPEAERLLALAERTRDSHPRLVSWLVRRPLKALELAGDWERLLATVAWIDSHDVSGLYLRQVDVPGVDTKFIGSHRGVLSELLDLQLAPSRIDVAGEGFEGRYGFRRKPGYVRFRLESGSTGFSEMVVRVDELQAAPVGVTRVYVIENEVTYLAFPLRAGEAVILGGGYAVGLLESLTWLSSLDVVYWGDIDTHGFAILNRLRRHFPDARSMLMDRATLLAHQSQWVTESAPTAVALDYLDQAESELYRALVGGDFGPAVRLEQERVSFARVWGAASGAGALG